MRRTKQSQSIPQGTKEQNLKQEKTVLEAFGTWTEKASVGILPKSKLGAAFTYAFNQKEGLMIYLFDVNCVLSNNLTENRFPLVTICRKKWLFSGSPACTAASAGIYSLIETAKVNSINPNKYIPFILSDISGSVFREYPEF